MSVTEEGTGSGLDDMTVEGCPLSLCRVWPVEVLDCGSVGLECGIISILWRWGGVLIYKPEQKILPWKRLWVGSAA
jgi:hypothetical protein